MIHFDDVRAIPLRTRQGMWDFRVQGVQLALIARRFPPIHSVEKDRLAKQRARNKWMKKTILGRLETQVPTRITSLLGRK